MCLLREHGKPLQLREGTFPMPRENLEGCRSCTSWLTRAPGQGWAQDGAWGKAAWPRAHSDGPWTVTIRSMGDTEILTYFLVPNKPPRVLRKSWEERAQLNFLPIPWRRGWQSDRIWLEKTDISCLCNFEKMPHPRNGLLACAKNNPHVLSIWGFKGSSVPLQLLSLGRRGRGFAPQCTSCATPGGRSQAGCEQRVTLSHFLVDTHHSCVMERPVRHFPVNFRVVSNFHHHNKYLAPFSCTCRYFKIT